MGADGFIEWFDTLTNKWLISMLSISFRVTYRSAVQDVCAPTLLWYGVSKWCILKQHYAQKCRFIVYPAYYLFSQQSLWPALRFFFSCTYRSHPLTKWCDIHFAWSLWGLLWCFSVIEYLKSLLAIYRKMQS